MPRVSVPFLCCLLAALQLLGAANGQYVPSWASGGFAASSSRLQFGSNNRDIAHLSMEVPMDHFCRDEGTCRDKQGILVRFWVDASFYKAGGPGLFTMGGEGRASGVSGGWARQLAKELGAVQVAIEHRFYGESFPVSCGDDPACKLSNENLQYLTVEQALSDAATILKMVDSNLEALVSVARRRAATLQPLSVHSMLAGELRLGGGHNIRRPWIAVGGSYSGALSAWFRQSYPHLVAGAISSSGVVNALLDYPGFDESILKSVGKDCGAMLARLAKFADSLLIGSEEGQAIVRGVMLAPSGIAADDFRYMLADSFSMAVQYGHKTSLCATMEEATTFSDLDLLKSFSNYTSWMWGPQFASGCFYDTQCLTGDPSRWEENGRAWRWQKCYEMAFLQRAPDSSPTRSPFLTLEALLLQCDQVFGAGTAERLVKQNSALQSLHGGAEPNGTSQIYFSNFSDDPWQRAGVAPLVGKNEGLPRCYVVCDNCGHCMDLHQPGPLDPAPLVDCRSKGAMAVTRWVEAWNSANDSISAV